MGRKTKTGSCFDATGGALSCCKVESLISIDERGQMVLPKEIREKAGIVLGISWPSSVGKRLVRSVVLPCSRPKSSATW